MKTITTILCGLFLTLAAAGLFDFIEKAGRNIGFYTSGCGPC